MNTENLFTYAMANHYITSLYSQTGILIENSLKEILEKQNRITGFNPAFVYHNIIYPKNIIGFNDAMPYLDKSLHTEMRSIVDRKMEVEKEKQKALSALQNLVVIDAPISYFLQVIPNITCLF